MLKPKLRFKEFNDNWTLISLNSLMEFKNGINAAKNAYGKGIKYISVTDILNNNFITYEKIKGLVNIDNITLKNNSVTYGDVVFQRSSETIEDIGRANVYLDHNKVATFGGFVIRGKKKGDYNPLFINYLLQNSSSRKAIIVKGAGAQHYNISQEELEKIELYFPSIQEQEKIANLLSLLDKKIELQKRKVDALKIYKKGLLSKLYYTKNGEKTKISDILEEVVDKSVVNNQYNVISSTKEDLVLQREYFNKKIASENNIGYKILKKYQIVFSPQNLWMGNINYNEKYNIGIVSPSYKVFNIKAGYDKNYIANLLKTPRAIYYYMINSEQGASIVRRNLNMETFYEISFNIPSINEQIKIGSIIRKICLKIDNEEMCLKQLERLKKGLLQKMFI